MLLELVVENYAVVERLRVRFHAGLNLLTGETGSGKSIVVDALGLLLGARGSAEMVRTGEQRARVAGIFDVRGAAISVRDFLRHGEHAKHDERENQTGDGRAAAPSPECIACLVVLNSRIQRDLSTKATYSSSTLRPCSVWADPEESTMAGS